MTECDPVNPQVTDAVTQANMTVLGSVPAVAVAQTCLALAQAQSVLFANMVSEQRQQSRGGGDGGGGGGGGNLDQGANALLGAPAGDHATKAIETMSDLLKTSINSNNLAVT